MSAGGSMVPSGMVSVSVASIFRDFMGVSFGNTLEWTNQTTPGNSSNGSFGSGMTSDQLPQLVQVAPDTIVAVNGSVTDTFLYDDGSYEANGEPPAERGTGTFCSADSAKRASPRRFSRSRPAGSAGSLSA